MGHIAFAICPPFLFALNVNDNHQLDIKYTHYTHKKY